MSQPHVELIRAILRDFRTLERLSDPKGHRETIVEELLRNGSLTSPEPAAELSLPDARVYATFAELVSDSAAAALQIAVSTSPAETRRELALLIPNEFWAAFVLPGAELVPEVLATGLADAHVHSGGAAAPIRTVELVARSLIVVAEEAQQPEGARNGGRPGAGAEGMTRFLPDRAGREIDLVTLSGMVTWACTIAESCKVNGTDLASEATRTDLHRLTNSIVPWSAFVRLCSVPAGATSRSRRSKERNNLKFREAIGSDLAYFASHRLVRDPSAVLRSLLEWIRSDSPDAKLTQLVDGAFVAACWATGKLGSPDRVDLGTFDRVFAFQSSLRWEIGALRLDEIGSTESERVCCTILDFDAHHPVTRLELRKTFGPSSDGTFRIADVYQQLTSHFSGVARSREFGSAIEAFQMPVGLYRRANPGRHVAEPSPKFRFDTHGYHAVVEAVCAEAERNDEFVSLIGGLDVAGPEMNVPNWAFTPAFKRLAEVPEPHRPILTAHAGESFQRPVEGLRRVDECLIWPVAAKRIGHALALSEVRVSSQHEPRTVNVVGTIEDFAWALSRYGEVLNTALRQRVYGAATRLLGQSLGLNLGPRAAVRAYECLFMPDFLSSVGVEFSTQLHEGNVRNATGAAVSLDPNVVRPLPQALALALLFDSGFSSTLAGADVLVDLDFGLETSAQEYWSLQQDIYSELLPYVTERLVASNTVIEACPTSNVTLGGFGPYSAHPLGDYLQKGLTVTLNSDDPGLFATSIAQEWGAVASDMQIASAELTRLAEDSMTYACIGAVPESSLDGAVGLIDYVRTFGRNSIDGLS